MSAAKDTLESLLRLADPSRNSSEQERANASVAAVKLLLSKGMRVVEGPEPRPEPRPEPKPAARPRPMTEEQRETLTKHGFETAGVDFDEAEKKVDMIHWRQENGLCTMKMARVLFKFGLNPDINFRLASFALDEIKRNGWRVPKALADDPDFKIKRTA